MKKILLFGAGKSATVLIDYLIAQSEKESWFITVADADLQIAALKVGNTANAKAVSFDVVNEAERREYITDADIVISLLPPALHILVAKDCLLLKKNLLTASYADEAIKELRTDIEESNLLFLYEMGLDPGIDHMSAMQIIDDIHEKGGRITSFKSHCGGLVAPESDDNPWHYKISWNPRNIVIAGKAGAHYRENGIEWNQTYEELFNANRFVEVPQNGFWGWYPNRDSLSYTSLYGLADTPTFVRTTLRHPDFMYGWKNIIELKLTDETLQYDSDGKTLKQLFKEHMDKHGFSEWLDQKLTERLADTKSMLEKLQNLIEAESEAESEGEEVPDSFVTADNKGNLEEIEIDEVKNRAAFYLAQKMHEANLTLKQLFFLGLDDDETIVNKGHCSAADILQLAIEKKLSLRHDDKDMILMLHEFEYELKGKKRELKSSLVVKGDDSLRTAMAKTVGLPLGIATKLLLNGKINIKGLHVPTQKEIYIPVLAELKENGIAFIESKINQ